MTPSAAPTLHGDDLIPLVEYPKADRFSNTPLQAKIHVLLPVRLVKVRLPSRVQEWINATIEMRILKQEVSKDSISMRDLAFTRDAVALRVTMMMGHTGRYFETKRADSPLSQYQHSAPHVIADDVIPRGQDQNGPRIQFMTRRHCSHSDRLGGREWCIRDGT